MKKIPIIMLALLLSACSSGRTETAQIQAQTEQTAASSAVTAQSTTAEETTEAVQTTAATETEPFEDTPENAYNALCAYMDTLDSYPEDYAGAYGYFGKLYVCTTEEDIPGYYDDILGKYSCISYRTVNHSLDYLESAAESAAELLEGTYTVIEHYADVPSNKAAVVLADCDLTEARKTLEALPELPFSINELTLILAQSEEQSETST